VCARETCTVTEPGHSSEENCYEPDLGKRITKKRKKKRKRKKNNKKKQMEDVLLDGRLLMANYLCI